MRSPVRVLLVAQLCLFVCLLLCVLLIPHFLFESNEGGVSNYGTFVKTVIPYTLGFGICGVLTIRAAILVPKQRLRLLLIILGALYLFVLLSTYLYKHSVFLDDLHHGAGGLLVLYTVAFGVWLSTFKARSTVTLLLLAVQLIGFLLAVLTFIGVLHVLFIAELLESLAFGALLVVAVPRFTEVRHQPIH